VTLTDSDTGEVLEFDFSRWIGETGGDIRKELPVLKMGKGFRQGKQRIYHKNRQGIQTR
jgi:hypothetical protein